MIYTITKYILKYIAAIFFQEVDRIGEHNTPLSGPLILCGNHSNQFCDPLLILTQCKRETSFLMAESVSSKQSYKKKIVGFFGRLLHAIPVKRPQDYVVKGAGLVTSDNNGRITGQNSKFTKEVHPGDSLKVSGLELLVKSVESDDVLTTVPTSKPFKDAEFKVIPKIDQSKIYDAVHSELKKGRCIGIFPEGGSHDRTTPLPLKAGVCLMALGAMAKHNITVTIQCIGLNYYQGHRFRSKAVLNFGVPYTIPRELATLYMQNRKQAIEILLNQIEKRLKEVWVTAPSFDELSHVFIAREIVTADRKMTEPSKEMELNLKFAKGYKFVKEKHPEDKELEKTVKLVSEYSKQLALLGITDKDVNKSDVSKIRIIANTLFVILRIFIGLLLSLPNWFLGVLLGRVIRKLAEKERVKALAGSSVKIHGNDVLASFKIVYGFVIFSLVSVLIGLFVLIYSWCKVSLDYFASLIYTFYAIVLFSVFWPFYMYLSLILSDRAITHFKKLYVRVLSICSPNALENSRILREEIKKSVKELVKKYGTEIFPDMKSKKPAKKIDFNDSINDAFGLLSEIGFN